MRDQVRIIFFDNVINCYNREAFMLSPALREMLPPPSLDPKEPVEIALPENAEGMHELLLVLEQIAHGLSAVDEGLWEDVKSVPLIRTINQLANRYAVKNLWQMWCQTQNWAWEGTANAELSVAIAFALGERESCKRLVRALGSQTETCHPTFWPFETATMFSFYDWYQINNTIAENRDIMIEDVDDEDGTGLYGYIDWEVFVEHFPWKSHWKKR